MFCSKMKIRLITVTQFTTAEQTLPISLQKSYGKHAFKCITTLIKTTLITYHIDSILHKTIFVYYAYVYAAFMTYRKKARHFFARYKFRKRLLRCWGNPIACFVNFFLVFLLKCFFRQFDSLFLPAYSLN